MRNYLDTIYCDICKKWGQHRTENCKDNLITPRLSWEEYAMKLAEVAALRSNDHFRKVGACILRHDNSVASLGFNGEIPGYNLSFLDDREKRRAYISHAESSALRYIKPGEGRLIACTLRPCRSCLIQIAMMSIKFIYFKEEYEKDELVVEIAKEYDINLIKL